MCDTKMEFRPPVALPRPYIQIYIDLANNVKHQAAWKELLDFTLYQKKIHIIDLRNTELDRGANSPQRQLSVEEAVAAAEGGASSSSGSAS